MMNKCLLCFEEKTKGAHLFHWFWWKDELCVSCRSQLTPSIAKFKMGKIKGIRLYPYNEFFSDVLVQYKESMDEALYPVFLQKQSWWISIVYRGYTLIPMPSSKEKIEERGFNHLQKMFTAVSLPILPCLEKKSAQKQVFSSRAQRLKMKGQIQIKEGIKIPKKVLLVDDVYTTGSTLQGAIDALKDKKCKIRILVVSKVG